MVQVVLRSAAGAVAGAVRMPAFVIPGLLRGAAPPSFTPQPSLKADAVPELPLQDVELVSLDGTKLHAVVDDGGKRVAGKRPIVFVHGYPDGWFCYVPQLGHFIDLGHPVLALSMRGYGASDKPEGVAKYHLFDCLAQDVRAAVNHMRALGKPLLVAHDWGSATSWAYVGQGVGAGEWDVAGYVSLSNPPSELFRKNLTRRQMWASLYMVFFNMPALPEWLLGLGNAWLVGLILNDTRSKRREKRWLDLYRTDKLQPAALRAQTNYYRAMLQLGARPRREDVLKETRKLQLPVLMIRGKQDPALLADLFAGYEKVLANAKLIELPDCSHWVTVDKAAETNAAIVSFMSRL